MIACEKRGETFAKLESELLDVLVIGGGIVGTGIAREAALRGLSTGLVEQHDFAFGTSSRSSRLLHGGLRYLAQGRIKLVFEASREKLIIRKIARHLAEPLAFIFPAYRGSPWPWWQLWLGVKLYDALCGGKNFGISSRIPVAELLQRIPQLNPEGLRGAVRYFDALTSDSRLVLDTLRSAENAGAAVVNYARFQEGEPEGGIWRCLVHDRSADKHYKIRARWIVNASGPWAGQLPNSTIRLRLTKGVHLVVDRQKLTLPEALVMTEGTRILFAIPWGERIILGTTDTDYHGSLEDIPTDPEDISYILEITNRVFPGVNFREEDVVSYWGGLRPLVGQKRGGPSDISRAHVIRISAPSWVDVAGGKLTTYRLIGQQTVDRIARRLGRGGRRSLSASQPLLPAELNHEFTGILPPPVSDSAIEHYCRSEWAVHLDDVMIRRSAWYPYHGFQPEVAERVARKMAQLLRWDERRLAEELDQYRRIARPLGSKPSEPTMR